MMNSAADTLKFRPVVKSLGIFLLVFVLVFQIFAPSATAASFATGPSEQHQEMAPAVVKCPMHAARNVGKDDARPEQSGTHGKCPHCTLSMCCVHAILTSHDLVVAGALLPGSQLIDRGERLSTAYAALQDPPPKHV